MALNFEKLKRWFCPYLINSDLAREIVAIQLLANPINTPFHVLLYGAPGSGKTDILTEVSEIMRPSAMTNTKTTMAGLCGRAGYHEVEGGELRRIDGGFLCIDEIDKLDIEVKNVLLQPLQSGKITTASQGYSETFDCRINGLAAGNTATTEVMSRGIVLPRYLIDRCHFIIPFNALRPEDYPKLSEILADKDKMSEENENKRKRGIRDFVATQLKEIPKVTINQKQWGKITCQVGEMLRVYKHGTIKPGVRLTGGMGAAVKALARGHGRQEAEDEDVERICNIVDSIYSLWYPGVKQDI